MRRRKLRSGTLVALVGALILVLGAAPSLAQRKPAEIYDTIPDKGKRDYPYRADRVIVRFKEALVEQGVEGKATTITVEDACGRLLSNFRTQRAMAPEGEDAWVERASVELDRRKKNPNGVYSVFVSYWLASDEVENPDPEDPNEPDPPNQEPRTYEYSFHVRGGPNCDGSPKPGDGDGRGGGGTVRVWGNTSGSGHNSNGDYTGHKNLLSASGSTTDNTTTPDFGSYTSPTIPSDLDNFSNDYTTTTPFGENDFGDAFGDTTGTSPLSDPTDPSLYESEVGQIPEEAEDQQTLSAAPADDVEPEPSTLVVALALALLLGVGGGLFLRKTDPAPIRS
jgi:hypothetical protein